MDWWDIIFLAFVLFLVKKSSWGSICYCNFFFSFRLACFLRRLTRVCLFFRRLLYGYTVWRNCKWVFADLGEVLNTSELVDIKFEGLYANFWLYLLLVIVHWFHWFFLAEIVRRFWGDKGWSLSHFFIVVNPFNSWLSFFGCTVAELLDRPHLRIQERVPE